MLVIFSGLPGVGETAIAPAARANDWRDRLVVDTARSDVTTGVRMIMGRLSAQASRARPSAGE